MLDIRFILDDGVRKVEMRGLYANEAVWKARVEFESRRGKVLWWQSTTEV